MITKASGYWSTKLLAERYCCSTRTIWRWTARETLPFPQPKIRCSGSQSLWSKDEVLRWEEQMDAANQPTTEAA